MRHEPSTDPEAIVRFLGAVNNLNDTAAALHTGMKTRDAIRLVGTNPRTLILAAGALGNPGVVYRGIGIISGLSFRETAGVATVIRIVDGTEDNQQVLWAANVPANGNTAGWFLPGGISHVIGIFVTVTGGAIEGAIYTGDGRTK